MPKIDLKHVLPIWHIYITNYSMTLHVYTITHADHMYVQGWYKLSSNALIALACMYMYDGQHTQCMCTDSTRTHVVGSTQMYTCICRFCLLIVNCIYVTCTVSVENKIIVYGHDIYCNKLYTCTSHTCLQSNQGLCNMSECWLWRLIGRV